MNCRLVVNGFLNSAKFTDLYKMFVSSGKRNGVDVEIKTSSDLSRPLGCFANDMTKPDFVIFWDKDIYLAEELEKSGLKVFNSSKSIELCDNKIKTSLALEGKVVMPETIVAPKTFENVGYTDLSFFASAAEELGFPMVIKEAYGSFGRQVYLANDYTDGVEIIKRIGYKEFLMQKFVSSSRGKDLRICVVGGEVVATMLRRNDKDFRSNITGGGTATWYEPTVEQKQAAITACEELGLDFGGVDILFGDDGTPIVCEVNSNLYFRSVYECSGVDLSDLIIKHAIRRVKQLK